MKTYNTLEESKTGVNFAKSYDLDKIHNIITELTDFVNSPNEFYEKNDKKFTKNYAKEALVCLNKELESRTWTPTETTDTAQESDVPATVVEIPINYMENKTATGTSNTAPKNVKKVLHKNVKKTIDKPKKNSYINNTNKTTTTTTKKENKTMKKNEIASLVKTVTIAPNAVKKIMVAQKTNKTDTKKTYWGGWSTVRCGMNAASNDYAKYDELQNEWHELTEKMGGNKSPMYHFCWKLINKNRVGVKQEPNATLRFIKNAKIRIAMANDVLANQKKYKNEIAQNWVATFGTEI